MLYYIFKDGQMIGRTFKREYALEMIHQEQQLETHYLLRAQFSIIETESPEEIIPYK